MKTLVLIAFLLSLCVLWAEEEADPKEVVQKCKDAAALIKKDGPAKAFEVLQKKDGPFVWKDSYVWVINAEKIHNETHPIKPDIRYKNFSQLKDSKGKLFYLDFINTAVKNGTGWVEYEWPHPQTNKVVHKVTYVMKVEGTPYIVAAGVNNKTKAQVEQLLKK